MPLADEILAVLNNPTHMWSHALRELPRSSQRLFLTLSLLPTPAMLSDLQAAYGAQQVESSESFLDSLRPLEDSFVVIGASRSRRRVSSERDISFRNPSLEEFSYAHLNYYSDWLGVLTNRLIFFEQIKEVVELALSRNDIAGKSNEYRYPEIFSWVSANATNLFARAIELHALRNLKNKRIAAVERLAVLIEFVRSFAPAVDGSVAGVFKRFIEDVLNPKNEASGRKVLQLIESDEARGLLDQYLGVNAASEFRRNILDDEDWKYGILLRLDEKFGTKQMAMASWGKEYLGYAEQLVDALSDCDHRDTISNAIRELEDMAVYLDADFSAEISFLQAQYDEMNPMIAELRNVDDDWAEYDMEDEEPVAPKHVTVGEQLDRIFDSLLDADDD